MELNIGDNVIYGGNGVCEIVDTETMTDEGRIRKYYVLEPVFNKTMKIYVPMDNEERLRHIRYALTKEQAMALIEEMPSLKTILMNNEHMRKEEYKKIISRADLHELVSLVKTLYMKKLEREAKGKKLYASDEVFLNSAEKLLYGELSVALGVERENITELIIHSIEKVKNN